MTSKTQAVISAIISAATSYVAYFIALPPQLQTGILGQLIAIAPPSWQPAIAGSAKTIGTISGLYATYKAAHSGS